MIFELYCRLHVILKNINGHFFRDRVVVSKVDQSQMFQRFVIPLSSQKPTQVIYMQSNKIHKVILMSKFYSAPMLARRVSDLIGPSSGAFCTSCIRRLWYVLIPVLLDTSSRCKVAGSSAFCTSCIRRFGMW